ncbi:hypothetical protein LSH36_353g10048 [Paralvinella palmiformis]|uniref:Uncharacterized protein n=1 Tax=Paralvinella palmiformis TaxID=53620 RepID=A0AAD9JFM3_9ANNE|nr:hypothetical protein LSH36_353g10048 [Paralvinella palmiformis]
MDTLDDKIEQIRETGIGHGLSDREIDSCILDALKQLSKRSKSAAVKRRRRSRCASIVCGVLLCAGVAVMTLLCLYSVAVWVYPDTQRWLKNQAEPWFYTITKNWRLLTLGITKTFDLSGFYGAHCLIGNPFVEFQNQDCGECQKVRKEHVLITVSTRQYENIYMGRAQPLILKGNHSKVTFNDLRSWYRDNGITFDAVNRKLQKAPPGVESIDDFLANYSEDDLIADRNIHVEWTSDAVNPSRLIRRLFSRPTFVPRTQEVSLLKTIVVSSPEAGTIEPNRRRRGSSAHWYVQGSGSREIVLLPAAKCDTCQPIKFVLEAGDILCYNGHVWRLQSLPALKIPCEPGILLRIKASYYYIDIQ